MHCLTHPKVLTKFWFANYGAMYVSCCRYGFPWVMAVARLHATLPSTITKRQRLLLIENLSGIQSDVISEILLAYAADNTLDNNIQE